ncbi:MAG: hypothetical protein IKE24_08175 [Clostridia bacterium]|nr:hypothetical protein [Clostridia bacterium]
MAFFRDETDYTHRQTGFARYRQLMSFYAFHWLRINMLTAAGALPLAAGILVSILTSSLVLLLPLSAVGGMIWGPFLAGQVDGIMRGLRDAPNNWWKNYQKSWRQNWKASLAPGALLGLLVGLFAFSLYVLYSAELPPTLSTLALLAAGFSVVIWFNTLYWPQLVLFEQSAALRIRNLMLFTVKHSVKVFFAVLLQLAWMLAMILFAPWTLIVIPFLGFWFPIFLALYRIYPDLNTDLKIEEQFIAVEGDPWAKDDFEKENELEGKDPFLTIQSDVWRRLVRETEQNAAGGKREETASAPEASDPAEGGDG